MLTLVAKTNVLTYGHDLWWRTFQDVAKEYPDIKTDYNHVDACCMWMVKNPEYYDVIVTTNMFGDIITDLAGILQGGMGVAAGGNINPDPGGTSMFEPMGGSAPKYTGQNVINPIAAINAAGMLLEHSGYPKAGQRVMKAVETVTGTKMKSQAAGKMGYGTQPGRRSGLRSAVADGAANLSFRRGNLARSFFGYFPAFCRSFVANASRTLTMPRRVITIVGSRVEFLAHFFRGPPSWPKDQLPRNARLVKPWPSLSPRLRRAWRNARRPKPNLRIALPLGRPRTRWPLPMRCPAKARFARLPN